MKRAPEAAEFVRALAPALRQSASIARALEGRVANRPKHGESSAVKAALTIADTASQEAILVPLLEHFPDVCLEAEEDTPTVHRFPESSPAAVVIDPIDGTLRFYLEGMGPYAVIVGLAVEGRIEAALLALPREGLFFEAIRGGGARVALGDAHARPVVAEADGTRVLVSHDLPGAALERLRAAGLTPAPASGGAISVAPLIPGVRAGLRLARTHPAGVSIRGRIGALVSAEAGARLSAEGGAPFPLNLSEPARALLVAANDEDLGILREALAAAAGYIRS